MRPDDEARHDEALHDEALHDEALHDEALLGELAAAQGPDLDPPEAVLRAARESFVWRTVDAELAALTHDSLLDAGAVPAGTRAGSGPRLLTFESAGTVIELEIDDTPGGRRLIGQLTPPGPARLELRGMDGTGPDGRADELGRFVLDLPRRPVRARLRVTSDGGSAVQSAWSSF